MHVLRGLTTILTTVLFMPIVEVFTFALGCHKTGSISTHHYFAELACYSSTHLAITILAISGLVIFVPFTMAVILVYLEPLPFPRITKSWDPMSKPSGNPRFWKVKFSLIKLLFLEAVLVSVVNLFRSFRFFFCFGSCCLDLFTRTRWPFETCCGTCCHCCSIRWLIHWHSDLPTVLHESNEPDSRRFYVDGNLQCCRVVDYDIGQYFRIRRSMGRFYCFDYPLVPVIYRRLCCLWHGLQEKL